MSTTLLIAVNVVMSTLAVGAVAVGAVIALSLKPRNENEGGSRRVARPAPRLRVGLSG